MKNLPLKKNLKNIFLIISILFIDNRILLSQSHDPSFFSLIEARPRILTVEKTTEGKTYVLGDFKLINGVIVNGGVKHNIVRLNEDGSHDQSFKLSEELANRDFSDLKVSNGKIILFSSEVNRPSRIDILNDDGSMNETFTQDPNLTTVEKAISDGESFYIIGNTSDELVFTKLSSQGTIDNSFGTHSLTGFASTDIFLLENDQILITGNFSKYDGLDVGPIFKVNSDGTLDNTFSSGVSTTDQLLDIELAADGSFFIAGRFTTFNGEDASGGVVHLSSDGSVNTSFNQSIVGNLFSNNIYEIEVGVNGTVYLVGRHIEDGEFIRLASLETDGSINADFPVTDFNVDIFSENFDFELYDEKLIIAASFFSTGDHIRLGLAEVDLSGNLLSSDTRFSKEANIKSITVQEDGKIIVAGDFQLVNGIEKPKLARLNPDGSIDNTFQTDIDLNGHASIRVSSLAIQSDKKVLIGGSIRGETFLKGVIRLNPDGSTDNTFDADISPSFVDDGIKQLRVLENDKVIIAGSTFNSPLGQRSIARLESDGSLDHSLDANVFASNNNTINELILMDDGAYLIAGYSINTPSIQGFLMKLNPDGSKVESFGSPENINALGNALAVVENRILYGINDISGGSIDKNVFLKQYNLNGELEDEISISISDTDNVAFYSDIIPLQNNTVLIAGSYEFINSEPHSNFAKTSINGDVDDEFNINVKGLLQGVTTIDSDYALISGIFTQVNSNDALSLAKVRVTNTPAKVTGTNTEFETNEEESITIEVEDFIITDPDDNPEEMTVLVGEGENFNFDGNQVIPVKDFNGTLSVPIQINDGKDLSDVLNIDIEVLPVNDPPKITEFTGITTTAEESPLSFSIEDLSIEDVDNSSEDFNLTVLEGENYSVDGLTITPATDFNGTLSVLINVSDGEDDSENFSIDIEVTAVNDIPIITGTSLSLIIDNETTLTIDLSDLQVTDPDNTFPTDFSLTLVAGDNYSLNGNSITPASEFIGSITVPVFVNDGNADSETFNLVIEVTEVTGFELELISKKVEIFPNPMQNQLNVVIENQVFYNIQIRIIDSRGFETLSRTYKKNTELFEQVIDLSSLSSGVFVVEIIQAGQKSLKRIIKN